LLDFETINNATGCVDIIVNRQSVQFTFNPLVCRFHSSVCTYVRLFTWRPNITLIIYHECHFIVSVGFKALHL